MHITKCIIFEAKISIHPSTQWVIKYMFQDLDILFVLGVEVEEVF